MKLEDLQHALDALADPTRLRILHLLFLHQDDDVWDVSALVEALTLPQPTVSRHLKHLRDAGLVQAHRDGRRRIYSLPDQQDRLHADLLSALEPYVLSAPLAVDDARRAKGVVRGKKHLTSDQLETKSSIRQNATDELHKLGVSPDPGGGTDALFSALARKKRRRLLAAIRHQPGVSFQELFHSANDGMSRQAIRKHLRVLETAELIHAERRGRAVHFYYNAVPLQLLYDRWTDTLTREWTVSVARVKYAVEARARQSPPGTPKGDVS